MCGRLPIAARSKPAVAKLLALATGCLALLPPPAAADDPGPFSRPSWREVWKWRETWAGVDAARDNWLLFSGVTVAPFGHIHEPGLRLRVAGGFGQYGYDGDRGLEDEPSIVSFSAATYYGDALIGYLERFGPLTAKAFAGVSYLAHAIAPFDDQNLVIGDDIGFKAVLELWLDVGDIGYAALDMSWNTAHETRNARARLGARVTPAWSTGLEAWLNLDEQSACDLGWDDSDDCYDDADTQLLDYTRTGLFLRYEWDGGEISASGGVSGGSFLSTGSDPPEPYGTLNWITQF